MLVPGRIFFAFNEFAEGKTQNTDGTGIASPEDAICSRSAARDTDLRQRVKILEGDTSL